MKRPDIPKRVCTIEQSNKLREMGIDAPCVWVYDNGEYRLITSREDDNLPSMYCVTELGIMLGSYTRDCYVEPMYNKWFALPGSKYFDTQAQCYAEKLIENLRIGIQNAKDCNKRLNNI